MFKIIADYEDRLRQEMEEKERLGAKHGHSDCVRITLNGKCIEHTRAQYAQNQAFHLRQTKLFFDHIRCAMLMPRLFKFNSDAGMNAARSWIKHHESRLKVKFSGFFELRNHKNEVVDSFTALEVE